MKHVITLPAIRETIIRATVISLTIIAAFITFSCIAYADESYLCRFSGVAKLDGTNVPDGTKITAIIDGDEYTTTTPTGYGVSTYSITIQPPAGVYYADGTEVRFRIDSYPAYPTAIIEARKNIRQDLTASTSSTSTSADSQSTSLLHNTGLLVGVIIACIVEVALVASVAYLTISNWNE